MASQEERDNYFSLTLLLFRVGNQKLREYFKTQWPIVYQRVRPGTVPPPWQDTPQDAAEMNKIERRLTFNIKDQETKFRLGNTNHWDFSLLTSVLRHSSLQFVLPSSRESKALEDLKKIRNELIGHATDAVIPNALFHTKWTNACNALALFNASAADFKCVQDDVKKPLDVLYPMLKQCVKQDSVDEIINRIEQLQQTVEQQHTTLQQVEVQNITLQQTVEQQHETQLEATRNIERKVDLVLSQGQQGQKRSAADVQPEEDVKTKKQRTTSDNRERDHAEDSEMLKEAIKGNTVYQTKIMAAHDVTSEKTDEIFTNLTVYYADKKQEKQEQAKDPSRSKRLKGYPKRTMSCKVEKYDNVFIDMKGENSKLLLTGKPGIGKTFLCEKVIRDWSMNRLFQNENTPNIQFAYLLKFRQLSLQGDKKMNLQELLNCSPLLDHNSVINDSLFEHLIQNPSKVLIILDGYDECSEEHRKQIASDYEERYINNPKEKMPIPALCSKLIRGKVLKNSVVLVSSRPVRTKGLGKIKFDRYVEISGFSPEQVTEYVDNYFREPEKEQTKEAVREHIEKNGNLISFCHIPLLSFLLCWCLEWRISRSGITENLPAKITDLYDEVVKVLIEKLHANLKYSEMSEYAKKIAEDTLDKLAKLGANLLKESKYIFDEEDMKKLDLTKDEIENLKVSGILHCVPGIRITAFQTKAEFSFTHLTLQEYLSASFFVKNNEIPKKVSGRTFVFMCGLLSRKKDGEQLMSKLIQRVKPKDYEDNVNKLLMVQCLYEYGEEELTTITINNLYDEYCDSDGVIRFKVTDADVKYVSYSLDIIRSLKEQPQSSSVHTLNICDSPLTSFGVGVVCRSLVRNSFITKLDLSACSLDDKCVEKITDSLLNTGITHLNLSYNKITDEGVKSICSVLTQTKITHLDLEGNHITDEGVKSICSVLTQTKITHLDLGGNRITGEGVKSICSVLTQTEITRLVLGGNYIAGEGVKSICSVLTQTEITYLDLGANNITDEGVKSICSVLTQTKITHLHLGGNNITDEGVKSICSVLTQTKITNLYLGGNNITGEGVKSICSVLTQTKITHLNLERNNITDEGVKSICSVLTQTKITHLDLERNNITDEGVKSICSVLTQTKITRLHLGENNITDEGAESICRVLTQTKITHLYLERNNITDEGVKSICSVLTQTKITRLDLEENNITDEGAESICRVITQADCQVEFLSLSDNNRITAECKERVKQLVGNHKPGVKLDI